VEGVSPDYEFNEITWSRHTPASIGVSPHKDQSFYTGVVAVLTLSGAARFTVLSARDEDAVVEAWETEVGDLTLMAAVGSRPDRRPWHTVGAPSTAERVTLTFRRTVRKPGGWR